MPIAKAFGAEVTAVCSTKNVDLVRSFGADQVVDYTKEDFAEEGPTPLPPSTFPPCFTFTDSCALIPLFTSRSEAA